MTASQRVFKVRRHYNKWVADQTMEDFALRFTARRARHMSISTVGKTALGATAFLALEGIAATVTLNYGFINTVTAMCVVCFLFFLTGFPIAYYSARYGLDIDLLTRGAGFGYLGSTITSLIYASFTFIFFAIEAAILASALQALLGIPLAIGYFICAVAVIPIVTHGITAISRFQVATQSTWLALQCAALGVAFYFEWTHLADWVRYAPQTAHSVAGPEWVGGFDWMLFGAACSVLFAMVAQIGEQVDYLRFLPERTSDNQRQWWFWLVLSGPGWVVFGLIKMLLGSFLAYLAITQGASLLQASDPTRMYQRVFEYLTQSSTWSLLLAGLMAIVSQMKINVTNAYAGSIAWSNFFSRVTHSHPGRVVWLVFNVTLSLILMELNIYQALEAILGVFAIVAVSWLGSLAADLLINKPLGLSPRHIEFKRAHLYDVNPVGVGSMVLATVLGLACYLGALGKVASQLSHFVSLVVCFVSVPTLAWLTGGRYYLARQSINSIPVVAWKSASTLRGAAVQQVCVICQNTFESEDMSHCTAYEAAICSLCCSLDARCLDGCKPHARLSVQMVSLLRKLMPPRWVKRVNSRFGRFAALWAGLALLNAAILSVVSRQLQPQSQHETELMSQAFVSMYFILLIVSGVVSWLFVLAHESRLVAQTESNRQTRKLIREIEAHRMTDRALQTAKEQAERANEAKTRYLGGISHELRTPLQSILGYAQLLEEHPLTPAQHHDPLRIIRRSGQYLTNLIEGLLDISKIEAGRLALNKNVVRLPDLLDEISGLFYLEARTKCIEFRFQVKDPLPERISTDEKRLRQILINLLSNAVKYTTQGAVNMEVRYRNQVAEFKISDTGPGIAPEDQLRIFKPFERVRNQYTVGQTGTGLGLTIVRLLVDIMGGDLRMESVVGEGTVFTVNLHLPSVTGAVTDQAGLRQRHALLGRPRTICLVDDDPILRGFLADLLVPLGFQVVEAEHGLACLQLLAQWDWTHQPIDAFVLDVGMPEMDGLSLARQLRAQAYAQPIVMLSADLHEQHRSADFVNDYNRYLIKPVSNDELLDCLTDLLHLEWQYLSTRTVVSTHPAHLPQHTQPSGLPALTESNSLLWRELRTHAELGYKRGAMDVLQRLEDSTLEDPRALVLVRGWIAQLQFQTLSDQLKQALGDSV